MSASRRIGGYLRGPLDRELSERHLGVIEAAAFGLWTWEIADELGYSPRTVEGIVHDACKRLGANNRPHVVALAIANGLIEPLDPEPLSTLTRRQRAVAERLAAGDGAFEIAERLGVRERTIRAHLLGARRAVGTSVRVGAVTRSALAALVASAHVRARRAIEATAGDPSPSRFPELAATAAETDWLRAFERVGLTPSLIASAVGVHPTTVRSWARGSSSPRKPAARVLDDLRVVVDLLLRGGMGQDEIPRWLSNRATGNLRPIDAIRRTPSEVIDAASRQLADLHAEQEQVRRLLVADAEVPGN